jgi:NAD(P)-dependent dehydrogenase (short-subunit alcohol dehydrogenase family)
MKICLADLSQEALGRAAEQLSAASVLTVPTAVSKIEEVQRLKERVYADFGEVVVLMNNAGTSPSGGPWDHYERWQRVLSVNLWGVINGVMLIGCLIGGGSWCLALYLGPETKGRKWSRIWFWPDAKKPGSGRAADRRPRVRERVRSPLRGFLFA